MAASEQLGAASARCRARSLLHNNVNASIGSVRAYSQSVISADSALKATEAGYEAVTRTIVDVLDSPASCIRPSKALRGPLQHILSILSSNRPPHPGQKDLEEVNQGLMPAAQVTRSPEPGAHHEKRRPRVAADISVRRWKCVGQGLPGGPSPTSGQSEITPGFAIHLSRMVLMMFGGEQPSSKFSAPPRRLAVIGCRPGRSGRISAIRRWGVSEGPSPRRQGRQHRHAAPVGLTGDPAP